MAATMANLFAGNPMTTAVGHKIEEATDPSLASEDWSLNMEICDMVNSSEETARDAARAIRKRLHHFAGKNYTAVMYTLTVLETCVKNCGRTFHALVCQKDYIQDLVKMIGPAVDFDPPPAGDQHLLSSVNSTIMHFAEAVESAVLGPRNEPPLAVQEKVLGLIRSWAEAFRGRHELGGVVAVYDELIAKGVQFPEAGDATGAPIITPGRSASAPAPAAAPAPAPAPAPPAAAGRSLHLAPEQADKLRREVRVVDGNLQVLNEMLSALKPSSAPPDDVQLLKHLAETCRAMQQRLVTLVGKVTEDDITAELLRLNDELNNAFIRYERFERGLTVGGNGSPERRPATEPAAAGAAGAAAAGAGALIDLGDGTDSVSRQLAGLAVGGGGATQQLSRIPSAGAASAQPPASGSATARPDPGAQGDSIEPLLTVVTDARPRSGRELQHEQDFDEMERWLKEGGGTEPGGAEGVLTNSEFDRFLAERAAASDQTQPHK